MKKETLLEGIFGGLVAAIIFVAAVQIITHPYETCVRPQIIERYVTPELSVPQEAYSEPVHIYKPHYMRVKVLYNNTISYCECKQDQVFRIGDYVRVNLITHKVVDDDPLGARCLLLDSYSPDDNQ